jgi:hypothetical protein
MGEKIVGSFEVTGSRGRRCKKLLDYLQKKRGYCKLKEETLYRTIRRIRCRRGYGAFVKKDKA